jgi:hypothetical protein
MDPLPITHVERQGHDTHADLSLRREWTRQGRTIDVVFPSGRTIQVTLHPAMTEGTVLRLRGQAPEGDGDLLLRIRLTDEGAAPRRRPRTSADGDGHERKAGWIVVWFLIIAAGLVLIGSSGSWRVLGIPARWVGVAGIAAGVIGLIGLDTFRSGPQGHRRDPPAAGPPVDA